MLVEPSMAERAESSSNPVYCIPKVSHAPQVYANTTAVCPS